MFLKNFSISVCYIIGAIKGISILKDKLKFKYVQVQFKP